MPSFITASSINFAKYAETGRLGDGFDKSSLIKVILPLKLGMVLHSSSSLGITNYKAIHQRSFKQFGLETRWPYRASKKTLIALIRNLCIPSF